VATRAGDQVRACRTAWARRLVAKQQQPRQELLPCGHTRGLQQLSCELCANTAGLRPVAFLLSGATTLLAGVYLALRVRFICESCDAGAFVAQDLVRACPTHRRSLDSCARGRSARAHSSHARLLLRRCNSSTWRSRPASAPAASSRSATALFASARRRVALGLGRIVALYYRSSLYTRLADIFGASFSEAIMRG
jgi:hypothetical protein